MFFQAYEKWLQASRNGKPGPFLPDLDYTPKQLFFFNAAHVCIFVEDINMYIARWNLLDSNNCTCTLSVFRFKKISFIKDMYIDIQFVSITTYSLGQSISKSYYNNGFWQKICVNSWEYLNNNILSLVIHSGYENRGIAKTI